MKSRTKPALRALPDVEVRISLPVQGALGDVRHAFLGPRASLLARRCWQC
jgi:hypothetical protein